MSANLKAHRVMFNETDKLRPRGPFTDREQWARIVDMAIAYQRRMYVGTVSRITADGKVHEFHDVQPLYDWPEDVEQPPPVYRDETRARFVRWLVQTGRLGHG